MNLDGEDFLLYVADSNGNYNKVEGQTGLSISGASDFIDQTAKGDTYKSRKPGRPDRTITCNGNIRLPDPTGLERVYALVISQAANNYQIRQRPFTTNDSVFTASMYSGNLDRDLTDQQAATYTFQLTLAAQPTVDRLGA